MTFRKFATFTAVVTLALAAAPALAAHPEGNARGVRYSDLNLASPVGRATLRHRIAAAVEAVCGTYAGTVSLEETVEIDQCRAKAQRQADQQVAELVPTNERLASRR